MSRAVAALVALAGAVGAVVAWRAWQATDPGPAHRKNDPLRLPMILAAVGQWGVRALVDLRYLHAGTAIAVNEVRPDLPLTAQVGDVAASGGPSAGPWQVERETAVELQLVDPDISRGAYAELAGDLKFAAEAWAAAFDSKLEAAGGDFSDAIRRYNGSGDAAAAYRDRALTFASNQFNEGFRAV